MHAEHAVAKETATSDTVGTSRSKSVWTYGVNAARRNDIAFPTALALMVIIGIIWVPNFGTTANLRNVLIFAAIPFIVAIGQTVVMLARAVDLSVGSMMALSGAVFAKLVTNGYPLPLALLAAVALGAALGVVVHGLLITKIRVSFLIVTLGTFAIFRSQANVVLNGESITIYSPFLDRITNGDVGPVPTLVVVAVAIYIVVLLILRATTFGRAIYAVGANPEAARLSGIPVDRVIIAALGLCGLLAAAAGILSVGQLGSAQPTAGVGVELASIASVLLGGTRFSGGYGGVTKTLFGVLFLGVLINILLLSGINAFWTGTASGVVLIAAVALDRGRRD